MKWCFPGVMLLNGRFQVGCRLIVPYFRDPRSTGGTRSAACFPGPDSGFAWSDPRFGRFTSRSQPGARCHDGRERDPSALIYDKQLKYAGSSSRIASSMVGPVAKIRSEEHT